MYVLDDVVVLERMAEDNNLPGSDVRGMGRRLPLAVASSIR
jgi:hypothetical protein